MNYYMLLLVIICIPSLIFSNIATVNSIDLYKALLINFKLYMLLYLCSLFSVLFLSFKISIDDDKFKDVLSESKVKKYLIMSKIVKVLTEITAYLIITFNIMIGILLHTYLNKNEMGIYFKDTNKDYYIKYNYTTYKNNIYNSTNCNDNIYFEGILNKPVSECLIHKYIIKDNIPAILMQFINTYLFKITSIVFSSIYIFTDVLELINIILYLALLSKYNIPIGNDH